MITQGWHETGFTLDVSRLVPDAFSHIPDVFSPFTRGRTGVLDLESIGELRILLGFCLPRAHCDRFTGAHKGQSLTHTHSDSAPRTRPPRGGRHVEEIPRIAVVFTRS